ncbi:hypothetical protein NP233_g3452 [Leucocoprinus birnbaumii]|uniref:AB hydrolase-1 domain-containing protein n=1 Tax=Leucocoprinus birnbaumii TaxID=56174 RepID=A0AAD5VX00_9AGAR|nr:hypothetical protein NP233_g3452 [Leucocoprinus birnbaumii]
MAAFFSFASSKYPSYNTTVNFPPKPITLTIRKDGDGNDIEKRSLRDLVEMKVTSIFRDFRPLWWLPNGHLQTIYCVLGDFSKHEKVWYNRTYLRLADGGTLGLDFTPVDEKSNPALKEDTPIIVVQHGLSGGSYESYVRAILSRAILPKEKGGLGYRAVVINFRGCAGVPITSSRFYSAGHTDDTRCALLYIASRYPKAPLLALGFSLGANVITRYLGEEKENARFHAACALACPWNLEDNNDRLVNSYLGKHIYSKGMGGNLQTLLKRHYKAISADPDHYVSQAATKAVSLKNPTLEEFDEAFTRIAGGPPPVFPFSSSREYYRHMSTHIILREVQVPFLAISAADDPVVRSVPTDGGGNPHVVMGLTPGGGHLGWFQAGGTSNVDRWTTQPGSGVVKVNGG